MNLYLKYFPLLLTYNTRIKSRKGVLNYIYFFIVPLGIPLVYGLISHSISIEFITKSLIILVIYHTMYMVFYEIGYIHNDIFSIEKEKKPTHRIQDNLSKKFRISQIITRIVISIGYLLLISNINHYVFLYTVGLYLCTAVIFYLHNIIRISFRNCLTFLLLRGLRFSIFIPIFFIMGIKNPSSLIYTFYICFLLENSIFTLFDYNIKIGGKNIIKDTHFFGIIIITIGGLWVLSKQPLFLYMMVYYILALILKTKNMDLLYRVDR